MKKRVLSILCVLALCLGLLPATALAADGDLVATVKIGEGETQYCVGTEEGNYDTAEAALKAAWSDCLNKTATLTLHKSVELSSSSQLSINYYTNSNTNLTLKMDNGVKLSKTLPISGGTPILVNDGIGATRRQTEARRSQRAYSITEQQPSSTPLRRRMWNPARTRPCISGTAETATTAAQWRTKKSILWTD